jgi:hypothetical protein
MKLQQRIDAFVRLGDFLRKIISEDASVNGEYKVVFEQVLQEAESYNQWFTKENSRFMLKQLVEGLTEKSIRQWLAAYPIPEEQNNPKVVAIIMAGNIPLVGFHDMMCVLLAGHIAKIKLSTDDAILPKYIIARLLIEEPLFIDQIKVADGRLNDIEAVIATGGNNTARYFDYYFGKYPNIIRKNRNSVAVITGKESPETLALLGEDIFRYFGLGCRNVSYLYVPENYDFAPFFEAVLPWGHVVNNKKYGNNYDYNRAVYLLNTDQFLDNNFVMIKESEQLGSPAGVIHFGRYNNLKELDAKISAQLDAIQCVVSEEKFSFPTLAFGGSQCPGLGDYADGVDTMKFLLGLN